MRYQGSYRKSLGLAAGAALIVLPVLAGCSSTTHASASASASPSGKDATTAGTTATPRSSTPESGVQGAVTTWIAATIDNNFAQACSVMGQPATGSSPAQAATPATCAGKGQLAQQMHRAFTSFHAAFTPEHMTGQPKVRVAPVPVTGTTATVPADHIYVDGQTLRKIILSRYIGVKADQFTVKADVTRIGNSWYVTGFDLNVG